MKDVTVKGESLGRQSPLVCSRSINTGTPTVECVTQGTSQKVSELKVRTTLIDLMTEGGRHQ